MTSWKNWRWWWDYAAIILGATICGGAIGLLLEPNHVVPGGITGLAMIIKDQLGVPYGSVLIVLNLPLLYFGWKYLGGRTMLIRTLIGVLVTALSIDLVSASIGPLTEDRLLIIFYGGLFSGIGLALVFHGRGTTGGTDILSRLIHLWFETGLGRTMLAVNVLVFGLAALIYGLEPAAVALMVSFVMTKSLDSVLHGLVATRSALVITERPEAITEAVTRHLRRGVTLMRGRGGYTGRSRSILYIVVTRSEVARLKRRINEADPEAFVTIYSPQEVLGANLGARNL
ncbi:MAG: YitT family protein [Candidatus Krumholzibacteriia bacterium]